MSKQTLYNFLGTYNKAYKTKIVDLKDFNDFISKFKNFYSQIKNIEDLNENLLKDKFKECVLNNYQIFINENRADLSIKKDNRTQVICEFKKPTNKNEMLQIGSEIINKKALQEAIWYFYNQDSKEISYQIKNIIITDTEQFFFFNPKDFCNSDLEKICLQFRNNQLAYSDTKTLYEQIGAKINEKELTFDYAEFDLSQYRNKILNNTLTEYDKKQLKYFYKALHPDFLLREFSPKDSNELNSKFYNELLYILGLEEEGKDKKKIVSSNIKGTLSDRISYDLNCNKFDDVINLIIVWLNRLLFLKLFESQLISFNDNDKSFTFLNSEKISDFVKLKKLFFNILGKPLIEREEHNIPYLNSSLFERSELEIKYGNISNLDSEITLPLFKGSILSKIKNYPKNPTLLKYILDFLEAYNFSSNISDEDNKKDIINSSVLGLIFEKLNGYKDGSFFTPAYITEYMAETSINNIVLQKFNNAFSEEKAPCTNIEDLKSLISYDVHIKERRDFYNEIIDSLKICDPAVGSGHFLVSVLNYLIALKSELGLLPIPNKVEVQNDSLVIYELDDETQFQYKRNNASSLKIQKAIFDEKRKIIENCLFGVDINPNSVQICCLRLWIELLKNTYYIGNTDEMQTLPNIDINIKCGNSLISNIKFETGKSIPSSLGKEITTEVNNYKELVKEYRNSSDKEKKKDINNKITEIYKRLELGSIVQLQLTNVKIIKDNLEQSNAISKAKFNAIKGSLEWAIAFPEILDKNGVFQGFDLIIGNPPYGIKLNEKDKSFYKNNYNCAKSIKGKQKGSTNTYVLFIERGLQLLKENSNLFYIVPMSVISSDECVPIQNIIEQTCHNIKISSYQERPTQIFDSACLRVSIIELYNTIKYNPNKNNIICKSIENTKLQRKKKTDNPNEMMKSLKFIDSKKYNLYGRYAKIGEKIDLNILSKIFNNTKLESYCDKNGKAIYYRTTGGRYFKIITNYSTGSNKERIININYKYTTAIGCILSSSLFWYYVQIYSNGLDLKDYEIKNFPIPKLSDEDIKKLEKIYKLYLDDIEKNVIVHNAKSYNISIYKEYKIVKSFNLIKQIDEIVCKLYGLTEEETNYIKNYEIEYRLSDTD